MSHSMTLELQQKNTQAIKQLQHMMMTHHMQQAIHVLQLPVMELSSLIDMELQQNPLLDAVEEEEPESSDDAIELPIDAEQQPEESLHFDDKDFEVLRRLDEDFRNCFSDNGGGQRKLPSEEAEKQSFRESLILAEPSLFEFLMQQAQEIFEEKRELQLAEAIIGNIDSTGLLSTPLKEIAVLVKVGEEELAPILKKIQMFDPPGIGGRDLCESLLIQLHRQGKQQTLMYQIVECHFDDLIHNRIPVIKKKLGCTAQEIHEAIASISRLDLHPGTQLSRQATAYLIPDLSMRQEGEQLLISVNDEGIPRLRLNRRYLKLLEEGQLPKEEKMFIEKKVLSAKWLMHNLVQRGETLERLGEFLAQRQKEFFFELEGKLTPLTMRQVAQELHLHESTVARAVANKYIDTPKGLLPLRFFFTTALLSEDGGLTSSAVARDLIKKMIAEEDKEAPLSDDKISALLKNQGVICARRTVAKYRHLLGLAGARQRRNHGYTQTTSRVGF